MHFHWQYLILNVGLYRTLLCTFRMCLQRNFSNFGRYSPRTVNNTTVSSCWGERLRLVGKRFGSLVKAPWMRIRWCFGGNALYLATLLFTSGQPCRWAAVTRGSVITLSWGRPQGPAWAMGLSTCNTCWATANRTQTWCKTWPVEHTAARDCCGSSLLELETGWYAHAIGRARTCWHFGSIKPLKCSISVQQDCKLLTLQITY